MLEERNAPYALLDLDFLAWFDTGDEDGPTEHRMMLRNLAALVGNYLAVGVRFFVLAKAVRDKAELEDLRAGLVMNGAPEVLEDLLLGTTAAADVPGMVSSVGLSRFRAMRMLAASARANRT